MGTFAVIEVAESDQVGIAGRHTPTITKFRKQKDQCLRGAI